MSGTEKHTSTLDEASSIAAFLSRIGITGTPAARPEDVAKKIRYLDRTDGKATGIEVNSTLTDTGAVQSTTANNLANPASRVPDHVPAEKFSEWPSVSAPVMSRKRLDGSLHQGLPASPQGSPNTAGVIAPPPTPESISSLAVGKLIYDELDRIPEDRFTSLGDSRFAPTSQFFSAVPRPTRPRDDPSFTRMSFKAADAPSVPSADQKTENARPSASKDGWSQTNPARDPPKISTPDTPDSPPAAPQLKPMRLEEVKTTEVSTPNTLDPLAGPLTPSSMTFTAASPTKVKAAGITTATGSAEIMGENLEGALYFKAWPTQLKSDERASRSAAKHRRVVLTGLPEPSTPTFVASLVFGGALESIRVSEGKHAYVTFLHADDAAKYYDATANGVLYKKEGVDHVIMTDLGKDVDPVSGLLREWTEKEFTRCVRAVGVDEDWSLHALYATAEKKGRQVEKVVDGIDVNGVSNFFLMSRLTPRSSLCRG
ncbi:MAG: hypothetical protein LQ348_000725 [Seirophora lacunosa]|nr:MAG: hypothetical protein LQ348_000725 [Seirophora lacunosa]